MAFMDILDELDPLERVRLLEHGHELNYQPGQVVIEEGDVNRTIYLVIDGDISVQRNAQLPGGLESYVEITRLSVGEIFGEMSLLTQAAATARIVAASHVRLVALSHKKLTALMAIEPGLAGSFYRSVATTLAHRLEETTEIALTEGPLSMNG